MRVGSGSWVRSPPPLPSIFLMDGHLTKTRGGKKGQITLMIPCVVFSGSSDNRIHGQRIHFPCSLLSINSLGESAASPLHTSRQHRRSPISGNVGDKKVRRG